MSDNGEKSGNQATDPRPIRRVSKTVSIDAESRSTDIDSNMHVDDSQVEPGSGAYRGAQAFGSEHAAVAAHTEHSAAYRGASLHHIVQGPKQPTNTSQTALSASSGEPCQVSGHGEDPEPASSQTGLPPPASGAGRDSPRAPTDPADTVDEDVTSTMDAVPPSADPDTASRTAGTTEGRQPAFEAAKRVVALYPYQQQERVNKLEEVGGHFLGDVYEAFKGFPEVDLQWDQGYPVAFTEADVKSIEASTEIAFVDVGGYAGGIKARHAGLGLFLKFAFDHNGFYQSSRMAAKAAKREAAASRWVHAMDSVHVSTPLLECVDLPVNLASGGEYVVRVQVFASVDVRGYSNADPKSWSSTTMRVGSSDGAMSVHVDKEQLQDAVLPLARHFFIRKYSDHVDTVIEHGYNRVRATTHDSSESTVSDPAQPDAATGRCDGDAASIAAGADVRGFGGQADPLIRPDVLFELGLDAPSRAAIQSLCTPPGSKTARAGREENDGSHRDLTLREKDLAKAVNDAIRDSGAVLDYCEVDAECVDHAVRGSAGSCQFYLPFDVELHQLDNGQRMVLDTHRLLIPDVPWIDWVRSGAAQPRVWVLLRGTTSVVDGGLADVRPLGCDGELNLGSVAGQLAQWWKLKQQEGSQFPAAEFKASSLELDASLGCVVARGREADGSLAAIACLACPEWYYRGELSVTCVLPPESARALQDLTGGSDLPGLCPDLVMAGDAAAMKESKDAIQLLYSNARDKLLERYELETITLMSTNDDYNPETDLEEHRSVLKRTLHGVGIGLRHAYLLLEQIDDDDTRQSIMRSLAIGMRPQSVGSFAREAFASRIKEQASKAGPAWQHTHDSLTTLAAAAHMYASKGLHGLDLSHSFEPCRTTHGGDAKLMVPFDRAGRRCVGTELASAGGIRHHDPETHARSLIHELAHIQAVGAGGQFEALSQLQSLAWLSSGLEPLRLWSAATAMSYAIRKSQLRTSRDATKQAQLKVVQYVQNLAGLLRTNGKPKEAIQLYEACLRMLKNLGEPATTRHASTTSGMADCYTALGRVDEAKKLFEESCFIHENLSGTRSSDYAQARQGVASCLEQLGKFDESVAIMRDCIDILSCTVGIQHPRYIWSLKSLAGLLKTKGKYAEAMAMLEDNLESARRVFGTQHAIYVSINRTMATCLIAQGKFGEAAECLQRSLATEEILFGRQHRRFAGTLREIGECLRHLGQYEEAIKVLEQSRDILKSTVGPHHAAYASTLTDLAGCVALNGDHVGASQIIQECRQVNEKVYGCNHPWYANTLSNTATLFNQLGKFKEAQSLFEECIAVRQASGGTEHPDFSITLDAQASCYQNLALYDKAKEAYDESLRICEAFHGRDHPGYIHTVVNYAGLLQQQGKLPEALSMFVWSKDAMARLPDRNWSNYATVVGNIAGCLYLLGRHLEALESYQEVLEMQREALGVFHVSFESTLSKTLFVCQCCSRDGQAIELLYGVLDSYEASGGNNHPKYKKRLEQLVFFLRRAGREDEAEAWQEVLAAN